MQLDACAICAGPALDRYAVIVDDLLYMTQGTIVVPLCEPHRRWLEAAGAPGRQIRDSVRWRLG